VARRPIRTSTLVACARIVGRVIRGGITAGALHDVDRRLVAFLATRRPAIYLCWHQDFVSTLGYLSRFTRDRRMVALASPSRDGSFAAAAARGVGYREVARGSSRDSGAQGLLRLARLAGGDRSTSVVIVADGPRPPPRTLKPGGLLLARSSGLPIWLVRTSWYPERTLSRTWARFHVPRAWGVAVIRADGPIVVPETLDREGLNLLREELELRMNRLADAADERARAYGRRGGRATAAAPRRDR
jgi:lysophospholipid acyltransferase (LPLAT)-like uncharacterized protein